MPNSNRGPSAVATARSRSSSSRSCGPIRRKAKIVFYVTWFIVTVLAATVAASKWHPVMALFAGLASGLSSPPPSSGPSRGRVAGHPGHLVVDPRNPPGREAWSSAGSSSPSTPPWPTGWPSPSRLPVSQPPLRPVRSRIHQALWCLVTRHRIRACFSEFIITNRTGSLPVILRARPTPVGERVWIWLRPGLSLDDLLDRLDKIAVACWATAALAEAASSSPTPRSSGWTSSAATC